MNAASVRNALDWMSNSWYVPIESSGPILGNEVIIIKKSKNNKVIK